MIYPIRHRSKSCPPLSEQVITSEEYLWQWSFGMKLRSGCFLEDAAGSFKIPLINPLTQIRVEPGNIDANWTLHHAARTSSAKLAETRVQQLASSGLPRSADSARVSFAPKGVSPNGLEVCARIQAGAAADAVQRLVQHRIFAHAQPAVVNQHQMKLALRGAIRQQWRSGEWRRENAGIRCESLTGCAGTDQFNKRSEVFPLWQNFFNSSDSNVQRRQLRGQANIAFA